MTQQQVKEQKTKYDLLLDELTKSRMDLVNDIQTVQQCKDAIIGVATNTTDYRSRFAKEDRIKTISGFYSTLLALRQEYNRNIISEIELRRKLEKGDDGDVTFDIVKIAKQLESARKNSEKKTQSIADLAKSIETNNETPGTNSK